MGIFEEREQLETDKGKYKGMKKGKELQSRMYKRKGTGDKERRYLWRRPDYLSN